MWGTGFKKNLPSLIGVLGSQQWIFREADLQIKQWKDNHVDIVSKIKLS